MIKIYIIYKSVHGYRIEILIFPFLKSVANFNLQPEGYCIQRHTAILNYKRALLRTLLHLLIEKYYK